MNNAALNIYVEVYVSISEWNSAWNCWVTWKPFGGTAILSSKMAAPFYIPTSSVMRVLMSPRFCQHLLLTVFFSITILAGGKWLSHHVFF